MILSRYADYMRVFLAALRSSVNSFRQSAVAWLFAPTVRIRHRSKNKFNAPVLRHQAARYHMMPSSTARLLKCRHLNHPSRWQTILTPHYLVPSPYEWQAFRLATAHGVKSMRIDTTFIAPPLMTCSRVIVSTTHYVNAGVAW